MSRTTRLASALLLACWTSPLAASAYCDGYADEVYMLADGTISIWPTWRSSYTYLCNVRADWKGVPSETCKHWYATLNLAVAEQQPIRVYYEDPVSNCATLPEYAASPGPAYVMLKK